MQMDWLVVHRGANKSGNLKQSRFLYSYIMEIIIHHNVAHSNKYLTSMRLCSFCVCFKGQQHIFPCCRKTSYQFNLTCIILRSRSWFNTWNFCTKSDVSILAYLKINYSISLKEKRKCKITFLKQQNVCK